MAIIGGVWCLSNGVVMIPLAPDADRERTHERERESEGAVHWDKLYRKRSSHTKGYKGAIKSLVHLHNGDNYKCPCCLVFTPAPLPTTVCFKCISRARFPCGGPFRMC